MKKVLSLILTLILVASSIVTTYALESGVTSFSITPIEADQKHKYLYVTIEAPKTHTNSKLLVGFYTDGVLKRLTPYDISTKTKFTKQKINTYVTIKDPAGNYFLDQTPDEIKIFTWDQNSIVPKTLCDNVLTPEVIKEANSEVVESLKIVPEATNFIEEKKLISDKDYENIYGEPETWTWDERLYKIIEQLDLCANQALLDAEEHLLSSLYAQARYKYELSEIRRYVNAAPRDQQIKLEELISEKELGKEYYDAVNNAMKFMDFTLTEK